jgi:hypothetical protein
MDLQDMRHCECGRSFICETCRPFVARLKCKYQSKKGPHGKSETGQTTCETRESYEMERSWNFTKFIGYCTIFKESAHTSCVTQLSLDISPITFVPSYHQGGQQVIGQFGLIWPCIFRDGFVSSFIFCSNVIDLVFTFFMGWDLSPVRSLSQVP